jgi:hypothetical protein
MTRKSPAFGFDPTGGNRLSEKIMRAMKNLDRDPILSNWISA